MNLGTQKIFNTKLLNHIWVELYLGYWILSCTSPAHITTSTFILVDCKFGEKQSKRELPPFIRNKSTNLIKTIWSVKS